MTEKGPWLKQMALYLQKQLSCLGSADPIRVANFDVVSEFFKGIDHAD